MLDNQHDSTGKHVTAVHHMELQPAPANHKGCKLSMGMRA